MNGVNTLPGVRTVLAQRGTSRTAAGDVLFCAALIAAHVGLTWWLRPHCFEAFDMAIAVDGGYRIYCGQVPYRDFSIPTGPVRHYLLALGFAIGGFSWSTVILCGGLLGATAAVLAYGVLRVFGSRLNAMLFALLTALTFNLPVAFPWFDHLAFLWALAALAAVAVVHAGPGASLRRIALAAAGSGIALSLAVMTKQNIGGAALIMVSLLWLVVPLPGRLAHANRWAAAVCAGTALAALAVTTLYFQLQGDFLGNLCQSGAQLSRVITGLEDLRADLSSWPHPLTVDVWTLVFLGLYLVACRFGAGQLTTRQRTRIWLATTALLITLAGRLTGSAPLSWFCGLSPLALGLLSGGLRRGQPGEASVEVSPRLARTLAWSGGLGILGGLILTLAVVDWDALAAEFDPAPQQSIPWLTPRIILPPFPETYELLLRLIVVVYLLVQVVKLSRTPRNVRLGVTSLGRPLIFGAFAAVASFYVLHDLHREGWSFSPSFYGSKVPFTSIPALAGCEASTTQVDDFEELFAWWQSHRAARPSWREGEDLCIMPFDQQFYGLLGVESFRKARLWYDPGLTFAGDDPDTGQLEATLPALIILRRDGRPYQTYFWSTAGFLKHAPRLRRLLRDRYRVVATLQGFEIWGRRG
jgi:hypothetical protein